MRRIPKKSGSGDSRAVATASGDVLGMGSKASRAEAAMLAQLEGAFPA